MISGSPESGKAASSDAVSSSSFAPWLGSGRDPKVAPRRRVVHAKLITFAAVLACAALFPLVADGSQLYLWETIMVEAVFALSVNLAVGHSGIPTFGQAAFFGTGAYAVAILSQHGFPAIACFAAAMCIAGVAAFVVGVVAIRSAGLGMLMLTLAVAQGMYSVLDSSSLFGGTDGEIVTTSGWPSVVSTGYWYALAAVCLVAALVMWLIVQSPFGLTMHAIRDDPLRALHLGVPVRWYRVAVFVLAGAFGGLAGGLSAYTTQAVDPSSFNWLISGNALLMCLIGGLYSSWGPVLGAVLYGLLSYELTQDVPQAATLLLGVGVMVIVLLVPRGAVSAPERARVFGRLVTRYVRIPIFGGRSS